MHEYSLQNAVFCGNLNTELRNDSAVQEQEQDIQLFSKKYCFAGRAGRIEHMHGLCCRVTDTVLSRACAC